MTDTVAPTDHPFAQNEVRLAAGPVRYRELGSGEPVVFVHGFLADGRLWDGVARRLGAGMRCIVPDWPMGSHRVAMDADADLSPVGQARIISEFIDRLGTGPVTVVGNDSGGAISQILATREPERVARLVLTNCDMFEKFPPFPFSLLPPLARVPGGMAAIRAPFRIRALGRAVYAPLARHRIDPSLLDSWLAPVLRDPEIAGDARKLIAAADKRLTLEAAERLRRFERPALLAWGVDDRFFRLREARRMAATIPGARLVEIESAGTFVALDQPERLAEVIAEFCAATPVAEPAGEPAASG